MPIGPMMFSILIFGQEPSSNIFANKYNLLLIQGSCYVVFFEGRQKKTRVFIAKKSVQINP